MRVVVVVVFLMLLIMAENGRSSQRVVTGTVIGSRADEWISVVNDTTDPTGLRIVIRDTTAYERVEHEFADPAVIGPGARVTVWYRSVGERHPVADKVRVLAP
jgi:hypothetical protein